MVTLEIPTWGIEDDGWEGGDGLDGLKLSTAGDRAGVLQKVLRGGRHINFGLSPAGLRSRKMSTMPMGGVGVGHLTGSELTMALSSFSRKFRSI